MTPKKTQLLFQIMWESDSSLPNKGGIKRDQATIKFFCNVIFFKSIYIYIFCPLTFANLFYLNSECKVKTLFPL